eukprot:TRINITY_DN12395_c0_g1_i3.p1 TRINITY_DN12395_c0_g1~~TRINITY_DN12395_c0_g1_i3.p1  ORF type:complete len:860 (+),score=240.59 TRINITY_DN12395_c0_g1_i3:54-2633(+)
MGMRLSIRTLNISLVVICIAAVAGLSTGLTVWLTGRALEDIKVSRDTSINTAFTSGEASVRRLTDDLLMNLGDGARRDIVHFVDVSINQVEALCTQLSSEEEAVASSWDYLWGKRSQLFGVVARVPEISIIGFATTSYQNVQIMEVLQTMSRGPDEYHHYVGAVNNGTEFDVPGGLPAVNRTLLGDIIPGGTGNMYMYPEAPQVNFPACIGSGQEGVATNGAVLAPPCGYPHFDIGEAYFQLFPQLGIGPAAHGAVAMFQHVTGIATQCVFGNHHTALKRGIAFVMTDISGIQNMMQRIDVGQERGSLGRIYATARSNRWHPDLNLIGTSHGSAWEPFFHPQFGYAVGWRAPILPQNCSDPLVAGTSRYLGEQVRVNSTHTLKRNEHLYELGTTHTFNLVTNRSAEGEQFYIRVQVLNNGRGIDWYVNTIVDHKYILGEIDAMIQQTKHSVKQAEQDVEAELREGRIILYVVVAVVSLLPIGLSVVLVFRITEPIMQLMRDMELVAVMQVHEVDGDRPHSALAEVRQMEESFRAMLRNLIAYRQYLPQSVLQSEGEEDVTHLSTSGFSNQHATRLDGVSHKSSSSMQSSHLGPQVHVNRAFEKDVRTKSTTILVSNLSGFHSIQPSSVAEEVRAYVEPFVSCAKRTRGIIDSISGDRVYVSFNSSTPAEGHKQKAVDTALSVAENWKGALPMNFGIASGNSICGNVGCQGLKSYSMIGPAPCNARYIERCGKAWKVQVLVDGAVGEDARHRFFVRKVLKARMKDGKPTMLTEILSQKDTSNDEWMYQLQSDAARDPCALLNTAVSHIYSGEMDQAREDLRGYTGPGCEFASLLLQQALRNGEAPEPLNIFDVPSLHSLD